jgi:hypothetical protein
MTLVIVSVFVDWHLTPRYGVFIIDTMAGGSIVLWRGPGAADDIY